MATHTATSSLIASYSSGQIVQTWMKCHTRLHPTRVITLTFVQNENVFSPLWFHTSHINKQCGPKSHAASTAPDQGRHCLGRNEKQIFFVEYDNKQCRPTWNTTYSRLVFAKILVYPIRVNYGTQVIRANIADLLWNAAYSRITYGSSLSAKIWKEGLTLTLHWCLIKLNIGQQIGLGSYSADGASLFA